MTNISAMRALAELNKLEAQRNSADQGVVPEKKQNGFSLFGFGFKTQAAPNPEDIPPEEKSFKA